MDLAANLSRADHADRTQAVEWHGSLDPDQTRTFSRRQEDGAARATTARKRGSCLPMPWASKSPADMVGQMLTQVGLGMLPKQTT